MTDAEVFAEYDRIQRWHKSQETRLRHAARDAHQRADDATRSIGHADVDEAHRSCERRRILGPVEDTVAQKLATHRAEYEQRKARLRDKAGQWAFLVE